MWPYLVPLRIYKISLRLNGTLMLQFSKSEYGHRRYMMSKSLFTATLLTLVMSAPFAYADSHSKTMGQKVDAGIAKTKDVSKETYEDVRDGSKKAYRKVQDETCEMINGKMECAVKRTENKVKNSYDKAKDKSNDNVRRTN